VRSKLPPVLRRSTSCSTLALLGRSVADFLPEIPFPTPLNAGDAATFGFISHEAIGSKLFSGQKMQLNKTSSSASPSRRRKAREMLRRGRD
jgi:hypothetical protein